MSANTPSQVLINILTSLTTSFITIIIVNMDALKVEELTPSKLGTKEYWEEAYNKEVRKMRQDFGCQSEYIVNLADKLTIRKMMIMMIILI